MKVVCAPDSYKESLSAVEASDAMAEGILSVLPSADVDRCPAGDGGEGTLASLLAARRGSLVPVDAHDALGNPVQAGFGRFGDVCWVETAAAIGLSLIPPQARDIMAASSFGAGEILASALAAGAASIVTGVGGSATNDGGCGLGQALGLRFLDRSGRPIVRRLSGGALADIAAIDPAGRIPVEVPITVACDVDNPLTGENGASAVFGPQKGATPDDVRRLDEGLAGLAAVMRRDLGIDVETMPGSGAAGGLAAGLVAFANAEIVSGSGVVLDTIGFDDRLAGADLCLTGEGRLDGQSLGGKTCVGIARRAAAAGVPVIALVGSLGDGAERARAEGISEIVVIGEGLPPAESMARAADLLSRAAATVAARFV